MKYQIEAAMNSEKDINKECSYSGINPMIESCLQEYQMKTNNFYLYLCYSYISYFGFHFILILLLFFTLYILFCCLP